MNNRQKIMIVDNEPEFTEGLQATFENKLYHVAVAVNRLQAQEALQREKPNAVLLGTITPRGDAFLLHKWLRETPQLRDTPILVIDAPREKQLLNGWRRDEALQMEAEDYLVKPVELETLMPIVERVLEKSPTTRIAEQVGEIPRKEERSMKSRIIKYPEEILETLKGVITRQDLANIERVIAEAKGKIALEPTKGFWEERTPCWEMNHCPEMIRSKCPAFTDQNLPCWKIEGTYCKYGWGEILNDSGARGNETDICQVCRVYDKYGAGEPIEIERVERGLIEA